VAFAACSTPFPWLSPVVLPSFNHFSSFSAGLAFVFYAFTSAPIHSIHFPSRRPRNSLLPFFPLQALPLPRFRPLVTLRTPRPHLRNFVQGGPSRNCPRQFVILCRPISPRCGDWACWRLFKTPNLPRDLDPHNGLPGLSVSRTPPPRLLSFYSVAPFGVFHPLHVCVSESHPRPTHLLRSQSPPPPSSCSVLCHGLSPISPVDPHT